jgi:ribosome-binding factor A
MESIRKMMSLDVEYSYGKKFAPVSGEKDAALEFSSRVMQLLTSKANQHNYTNEEQVTSEGLKEIFVDNLSESLQITQALANVNVFLNICSAGLVDDGDHFEPSMEEIKEAEREVKRHGLASYDFRDVDDLYFQSDEQARSEAKDWLNSVI